MKLREGRERLPIFLGPSARALGFGAAYPADRWKYGGRSGENPRLNSLFCERGAMAGNGREMARKTGIKNQERSNKASETRRAAAKSGTPSTSKKETNTGKEAEEKKARGKEASGRRSAKPGADLLEDAADAVVSNQCQQLAKALMNAAKKGNASCAKVLVTLTEKVRIQKEGANKKKGRSAANLLASEPDWPGVLETDSQAGSGAIETKTQ
jgi:hypothetical protein